MSRLIPQREMSADQIMDCSYQAQAIISLCRFTADNLPSDETAVPLGSHIDQALAVAYELVGIMHDALESHEGLKGVRHERQLHPRIRLRPHSRFYRDPGGPRFGLVPWPKHLQPREASAPEEAKPSQLGFPKNPSLSAGGVFFVTLSPDDRAGIATTIERLINMLDDLDGDENLEATGDDEPSLGWPEGRGLTQLDRSIPPDDREDENEHGGDVQDEPHDAIDCGDDEPNLGRLETLHQGAGSYEGISDDATGLLAGNLDFRGDGYRQTREALRSRRISQFPREYAERVSIMPDGEEFRTFVPIRRDRP